MKNRSRTIGVSVALAMVALSPLVVYADGISPNIRDTGKKYSIEAPKSDYYGTGIGGRAMEAMDLRFQVERALQDGEYEIAISKAKKAAQLDPADPGTHLLLARALTKKLYMNKGPVDEKLLRSCLYEWTLLWHHDADQWDQVEAKNECRRLSRIVKVLDEQKLAEQIEREHAKEQLAQDRARSRQLAIKEIDTITGAKTDSDTTAAGNSDKGRTVASSSDKRKTTASTADEPETTSSTSDKPATAANSSENKSKGATIGSDKPKAVVTGSKQDVNQTDKPKSTSANAVNAKRPIAIAAKKPADTAIQEPERPNPSIQEMESRLYMKKKKRFLVF